MRAWEEIERLDHAVYGAVASASTPMLDRGMARLSEAADYSRLSLASAAGLALAGGASGRRAAVSGLAALTVTAALVNLAMKPLARRRRPDRPLNQVPTDRQVPMPRSRSFPSGHAAVAFAFAGGAGRVMPASSLPLHCLAGAVGYSRVHTGVHYPLDVLAGALIGAAVCQTTSRLLS